MATHRTPARWALPAILGLVVGIVGGALGAPLLKPTSNEAAHEVAAPIPDEPERETNAPLHPLPAPKDTGMEALLKQRNQRISKLLTEIELLKQRPEPVQTEPKPVPEPVTPPADAAMELREALGRMPTDAEIDEYAKRQQDNHEAALAGFADEVKEREAAAAALQDGDIMNVLRNMDGVTQDMKDAASNSERFAKYFERKIYGPAVDGSDVNNTSLQDGTTVRFASGIQKWKVSDLARIEGQPFPKDLLLVGAGRDETLLSIDEFRARSDIRSLTFQDLTLDCANNYMTRLRSDNPITIRFERCRIVRFDKGSGQSSMLDSDRAAFFATDTLIECGYGLSPSSGTLFVCRHLVARLERCTISWPGSSLGLQNTVTNFAAFVDCSFIQVPKLLTEPALDDTIRLSAVFTDCSFEGEEEADYTEHNLMLEDINPAWKDAQ